MKQRTAHGAKALPREYYISPAVFDQEMERVFYRHWLCVGRESQIKDTGAYVLRHVGAESVIVVRTRSGRVGAFYNVCRHRGTLLCNEDGRFDKAIRCPYHGWSYDLDGRLLGAPNMNMDEGFDPSQYQLIPVATAAWEGFLFIHFATAPVPLQRAYAPIYDKFADWQLAGLKVEHRIVYNVAANWKLLFQNYAECYHCPTVHPALNRMTPYRQSSNDVEAGPILGGPMQIGDQYGSLTMSGRRCAPVLGRLSGPDVNRVYYYTIFPNLCLSLHPDYVLVHRLEPQSPGHTRVICEWLFDPAAVTRPDFAPEEAIAFWDAVNRQDWHVCELSQRGVRSRAYTPGPYAALESVVAAFDRHYLQALGRSDQALGPSNQALGRSDQALGRSDQALGRSDEHDD